MERVQNKLLIFSSLFTKFLVFYPPKFHSNIHPKNPLRSRRLSTANITTFSVGLFFGQKKKPRRTFIRRGFTLVH